MESRLSEKTKKQKLKNKISRGKGELLWQRELQDIQS